MYPELVSALSESGIWKHDHHNNNAKNKEKVQRVSGGERWYKLVVEMDKRIIDTVADLMIHPQERSEMEKILEESLITHSIQIGKAQVI